ncbi:MAG: hypothetical protein GWO38_06415, partial [Phycisphaerae bacterium]|nr:hypothetical protein [Phycisphaerae bacterium]NIW44851.1 hypothetical protein [Gammaproteobacteria bacterium]NIW97709.1 hypothetical protein [Phycisphaerae bacterium]NIX27267.1 hypothetical protein [Phycisphaerae bacterium]
MNLVQFFRKYPWTLGGALFGIVSSLMLGVVVRATLNFTSSEETSISIILLIVYTGIGSLAGSILGAIYRKVQSKQFIKRYRWWALAGAIYGLFSGTLGGASMGWRVGQLIAGERGMTTSGIIISITLAVTWATVVASLSAFVGTMIGAGIGALIGKRFLYAVWFILCLYICIRYYDAVGFLWRNTVTPGTAFFVTFLVVTGLGWVIIKRFGLQSSFEQGIQKL